MAATVSAIGTLLVGIAAVFGLIESRRTGRKVDDHGAVALEAKAIATETKAKVDTIEHSVNGVPEGEPTIREKVDALVHGQAQHAHDDARRFGRIDEALGLTSDVASAVT